MRSSIKSIFPSKNNDDNSYYGFIASTDGQKDYYFTSKNFQDVAFEELSAGLEVEFTPYDKDDKRYANRITLLNKANEHEIPASHVHSASYLDYQKQIVDSLSTIDKINDSGDFEDATHLILRLLGIHSAYQFDRKKQAGKADGIFTIENLIVMYDCTLNVNFTDFKKDQIENYINKLNQKEQLTVDVLKIDGSSTSKMFKIENKKRQVWIITRGKTREINDYDNIKVKEICIYDLISLLSTRIKDSSYDIDRLTSELILLGN
ncbi:hypothetical protein B0681_00450 [Moraxella porci DSM 25326]|uniref:CSD domain-containing protein n=1 Tax=Moraxella porci DSM 25326 TaxID=573983 RepID=A0A1T0CVM0_9GAMM|nr:cold shock domain-containing protein [Moraxella porci]OOS26398.1 hypothetical protein B0681_00450 [Moraxella porci DSM 25326]